MVIYCRARGTRGDRERRDHVSVEVVRLILDVCHSAYFEDVISVRRAAVLERD